MDYPVFLSSFVGRKLELGEITSLLRGKSIRLLTLIGPGGGGKTRLALESFRQLADEFEDGVVWIDLSAALLPEAVPQALASALGVNPAPGQSVIAALQASLQSRETLIVLDNCEHLVSACAQLADALLRTCPALHLLAASRQKLGVQGEQVWQVPPLSYPADDSAPTQAIIQSDAVQLFRERARQADPTFEISERNAPALARICRLLEGMPLAIELSAARVNVLDLPEISERLASQLSFLTSTGHPSPARHQSMRETIRWSYELLSEAEQMLFRRLGVFAGGLSLETAEAICGVTPLSQTQILDLIGKLIDKSLLVRENTPSGVSRYRQLDSIREFAAEQLEASGEDRQIRERHFEFYARLITEAEPRLVGADQQRWTGILEREYDNLRAALSWAFRQSAHDARFVTPAVLMANRHFWFWNYSERYDEAIRWYSQALDLPELDRSSPATADLYHHKATFVWLLGDYGTAQTLLTNSLVVAQTRSYSHGIAHAQLLLGVLYLHQGQSDRAVYLLQQSEALCEQQGDWRGLGIARTNLGGAFLLKGDLARARAYSQQAVDGARANEDSWTMGLSLSGLGNVLYQQGKLELALDLMERALQVLQQSGQQWLAAEAMLRLAKMRRAGGNLDDAEKWLERCFHVARESGAVEWQIAALEDLGFIALSRGSHRKAAGYFVQVLRTTKSEAYQNVLLHVFLGIVEIAAREGRWDSALALWNAYQALKDPVRSPSFAEEKYTFALLKPHLERLPASEARAAEKTYALTEAANLALEIAVASEERIGVPSAYDLRLLALGSAQVYLNGQLLVASDWTFAKPQELLFYLASNPPMKKEQIGLDFWPDASPNQLRVSLRAALYHLRRAVGHRDWVLFEDGYYRFNRSKNYWYDVEAFEQRLAAARVSARGAEAIPELESVLSLYRGDFMTGIANDAWGAVRREELRRKYIEALSTLGQLLLEAAALNRAAEVFAKLIAEDNLLEHAHRGLMRAYALQGERVLALRQYHALVEILRDELGISPSSETTELYRSLLPR